MPIVTGEYGCARLAAGTDIVDVLRWTMNHGIDDVFYASCGTGGKRSRVVGTEDLTGTIVVAKDEDPSNSFRTVLPLKGLALVHLFEIIPQSGVPGVYHEIPIIVQRHEGGVDIGNQGPQEFTISWAASYTVANPAALFDQVAAALP